jgi:rSAM/selenodomain-associated transferase 1
MSQSSNDVPSAGKFFLLGDVLEPDLSAFSGMTALAVMTKAPRPGQVKTRLVPPLTAHQAAELNACFLIDTFNTLHRASAGAPSIPVAAYTPAGKESAFEDILPNGTLMLAQRGEGFGERLLFVAEDLFSLGFSSVCLIDSDSPTVLYSNYRKAVNLLHKKGDRTVLGPCDDGGYYLIGIKQMHVALFSEIEWSTDRVLQQTVDRARQINLECILLPTHFDVDDAASLSRLTEELSVESADDVVQAARTRAFLASLHISEAEETAS